MSAATSLEKLAIPKEAVKSCASSSSFKEERERESGGEREREGERERGGVRETDRERERDQRPTP